VGAKGLFIFTPVALKPMFSAASAMPNKETPSLENSDSFLNFCKLKLRP
jgi:hypothetical protein